MSLPQKDARRYKCFCGREFKGRTAIVKHMQTEHTVAEVFKETGQMIIF